MSELKNLANGLSLIDELSVPTEEKTPPVFKLEGNPEPDQPPLSTTDSPEDRSPQIKTDPEQDPELTKLQAEESADTLVALLDGIQSPVFVALHMKKFKKNFSKEDLKTIQLAKLKSEVELTEAENSLKLMHNNMKDKLSESLKEIGFTDEETDRLKRVAMPMVRRHGIDIPPSLAFALIAMQVVSNRVIDLIVD